MLTLLIDGFRIVGSTIHGNSAQSCSQDNTYKAKAKTYVFKSKTKAKNSDVMAKAKAKTKAHYKCQLLQINMLKII